MPTPRPPTPEDPQRRWSTRELRRELGLSDSVFRRLQRVAILAKPTGRGRSITYSDADRIRAHAALRLKVKGTSFTKSARLLAAGRWEQTLELAGLPPPAPAPASPVAVPAAAPPTPAALTTSTGREKSLWSRVVLEPGIELHINLGASADPERLTRLLQAIASVK